MSKIFQALAVSILAVALTEAGQPAAVLAKRQNRKTKEESTGSVRSVLWSNPADAASRDLFYGPGGKKNQPRGPFKFLEEDLGGSNPKFSIEDKAGVRWKVKLGPEARSETAASRLMWAAGYATEDNYFVPELKLENRPAHLKRGQNLVSPDGIVKNARLRLHVKGEEKLGNWHWNDNPFLGSRELNGLRALMALINNWDLKDENNALLERSRGAGTPTVFYCVRDLGASFGATGHSLVNSKDNLRTYEHSKFIDKAAAEDVNFATPALPALISVFNIFGLPEFISRVRMTSLGNGIPREDVRWVGEILGRLSHAQIREAFRGAGYSAAEVDGFTRIVETRIAQMKAL